METGDLVKVLYPIRLTVRQRIQLAVESGLYLLLLGFLVHSGRLGPLSN